MIGFAASIAALYYLINRDMWDINIQKSNLALCEDRLDSLRAAKPYGPDTLDFSIKIIHDSARAKEIRDYFHLDTLFAADADTWSKTVAIAQFVAKNIPHGNQSKWPDSINAIGLWEYTKKVEPAFNCRLHSIMTFELLISVGIDARYVTCLPQDGDDPDCHVVNEVWLPEQNKWAMIDADCGGNYITDKKGIPLSLLEIRESFIQGTKMVMHKKFDAVGGKNDEDYAYLAKNTYWFNCWGELSYYQEDFYREDVVREHDFNLVPGGFEPANIPGGSVSTTNAEKFWAPPVVTYREKK